MSIDDLLYMIGRLTVEKEMLLKINAEQEAQIKALLDERTPPEGAGEGK